MYDTILRNEFKRFSGQDLTDYELTALKDFIDFYGEEDWDAARLSTAVLDFLNDCYEMHDIFDENYTGPQYTILDWWEFPMAHREGNGDTIVITYRGGKMTKPKGVL